MLRASLEEKLPPGDRQRCRHAEGGRPLELQQLFVPVPAVLFCEWRVVGVEWRLSEPHNNRTALR